ncbi:MAG TPA: peptide chain release factor N(5)-glutamine methyltransferase [Ohtaekwangia sp.]|uniref:peptide chain release factor N(5)-glutamine methyltransferase n=1 Tax=Ohtaekwangia sp. TaxID=2066019 RepID=UPI002F949D36
MKNSKDLVQDFVLQITLPESKDEIASIAQLVLEKIAGITQTDIFLNKAVTITPEQQSQLDKSIERINRHEPVQYILEEADFFGRTFYVNAAVLIPRPETEYLIREITAYRQKENRPLTIVDIGTGSGCIPVTLSLELPGTKVYATDIQADALAVATENSKRLKASVTFQQHDILMQKLPWKGIDVVVSNPPYIAKEEEEQMRPNVTRYEPHIALFVPDNDPLKFYRAIAIAAKEALSPGGMLIVEINERFGQEVMALFQTHRFGNVSIVKDLDGKDRIVKGILLAV